MKAIYLDIDGVLISFTFEHSLAKYNTFARFTLFDQRACLRLLNIIEETGAEVILSSSWRLLDKDMEHVRTQLAPYGIVIADRTGNENAPRGEQIAAHLARHPEITDYVVLDDEDHMDAVRDHFVQTTFDEGLQDEHVQRAIEILRKKENA